MSYHPTTHLAIARERHQDLIRGAEQHRLARSLKAERPGIRDRIASFLHRGDARRVAPAAK